MAVTKKEQLLADYKKERRRIQSNIARLRKKGFSAKSGDILPDIPKKITEGSIRRLQKMNPKIVKEKVLKFEKEKAFLDIEKDVIQKPKPVKSPKGKRAKATQTNFYKDVVGGFLSELIGYPVEIARIVEGGIKKMVTQKGVEQTANALLNIPITFHDMMRSYKSYGEAIENFFGAMANYLDLGDSDREELENVLESGINELY